MKQTLISKHLNIHTFDKKGTKMLSQKPKKIDGNSLTSSSKTILNLGLIYEKISSSESRESRWHEQGFSFTLIGDPVYTIADFVKICTCCWCANVCFISTILMLCSMAYFFALLTRSLWSEVSFGRAPPRMPAIVLLRAPGPYFGSKLD